MTRAFDIKQLIAEQASGPAERRALEEMANRLDDTLSAEVPYRPEFKAQLRRELMATARKQVTPWYRRPAFLGSGVAVAAAAAVLVVGMNLWQTDEIKQVVPPVAEQPGGKGHEVAQNEGPVFLVSVPRDVPVVQVADERLTAATPGPNFTGNAAVSQGLQLKRLTARPNEEQLSSMAARLAFRGESRPAGDGWVVTEGSKTLTMTASGQVGYSDTAPAAAQPGASLDAEGARQVAHRFLDRALLPIHETQPAVTRENSGFTVVYTQQVDGRPVVNARTVVQVSPAGGVLQVESYVASGTELEGTYTAVLSEAEAVAEAKRRGGSFDRADLVWVRSPGEGTVYIQPYWRVFGTDSQGNQVLRYVPALKR